MPLVPTRLLENKNRFSVSSNKPFHTTYRNAPKDFAGARGGQAVELERVGPVAVCRVLGEIARQVDDGNGVKRALLHADAAADAQRLGDEGNLKGKGVGFWVRGTEFWG